MTRAIAAALVFALGCATTTSSTPPPTPSVPSPPKPPSPPIVAPRLQGEQPLGARAAPFAFYIVAMHRQIHKLFTLGFLADIDARHDPAYADDKLWTQLRIIVNADGTVDRVRILQPSGLPAFDRAAIDSVTAAAPFPPTPEPIRSADGKVYVDWQFHRDDVRSCGTPGVAPHLFGTPAPPPADARAQFLVAIHRQIHERFSGFLSYLDNNRRAPPLDDQTLWTEVELAVRRDGAIDHADLKRPSGVLAYDVAVLDSVLSSAPFVPPPATLLDADGLFHVDWTFHRDERACGLGGVDPLSANVAPPASEKALQ